jgi:hypothetical protein
MQDCLFAVSIRGALCIDGNSEKAVCVVDCKEIVGNVLEGAGAVKSAGWDISRRHETVS